MGGPSAEQNELSAEETAAYKQAQQMTAQQYANQQAIYGPMAKQFQSIFDKGPNQQGFSDAEKEGLDAQAVAGTASNYSQAAKAVGESTAAEGGGTNPLPTGASIQLKQEVANSAASSESAQETEINQADYAQGYNEWGNAASGLEAIATGENPLGYENAETNSGNTANTEANAIAEEDNSWINAAIGAAGSIGASAETAWCPAKGTMILMADGSEKLIEEIRVGDEIRGVDGMGQTVQRVESAVVPIVRVVTKDEDAMRCSWSHTFVRVGGGFTVARDAAGTQILFREKPTRVMRVDPQVGRSEVFNLFTDGSHTYCANGFWSMGDAG